MSATSIETPAAPCVVATRSRVILAVDDEPAVRRVVAQTLGREYSVIAAASAREALEYLSSFRVDLVLTDINMPEMGGLDLADRVLSEFPSIPIAFLSAYLDEEMRFHAGKRSRHMISKPFQVGDLSQSIHDILRESGLTEAPPPAAQPSPTQRPAAAEAARPLQPPKAEPTHAQNKRELAAAAVVWQLRKVVDSGKTFKMRIQDEGMRPVLEVGDLVEIAGAKVDDLRHGDLVFVHQDDLLRPRRFMRMGKHEGRPCLLVRGEGAKADDPPLPLSRLIGRVTRGGARAPAASTSPSAASSGVRDLTSRIGAWIREIRLWLEVHGGGS